jgi:hypothetical protein
MSNPPPVPVSNQQSPEGAFVRVMLGVFVVAIIVAAVVVAVRSDGQRPPSGTEQSDVMRAVAHYIQERYPAVEDIDEEHAVIKSVRANQWDFAVAVTGKNRAGVRTKNGIIGTIETDGNGGWRVNHMESQAMGEGLK